MVALGDGLGTTSLRYRKSIMITGSLVILVKYAQIPLNKLKFLGTEFPPGAEGTIETAAFIVLCYFMIFLGISSYSDLTLAKIAASESQDPVGLRPHRAGDNIQADAIRDARLDRVRERFRVTNFRWWLDIISAYIVGLGGLVAIIFR